MLFRTQIIFCSSELRLHFRIAEVGSLLSVNRAWRAQVTFVNRELSVLFQTELVPSLTTYNGDAKVVWLRVNSSEK